MPLSHAESFPKVIIQKIIEQLRLAGTSRGHLVQYPCSSRAT